jgi:hypothetical protein
LYGIALNAYGCEECFCNPCPKIDCPRAGDCKYGLKRDVKTGCPICVCNEFPYDCNVYYKTDANGTATTTTASLTIREKCALDCTYGFVKDDRGCDTCVCKKPDDVCVCTKPASYTPRICRDGSPTYITDSCVRTATGCAYRERICPLVIVIKVDTAFTAAELQALFDSIIRYSGTVGEADVTIKKEVTADGKV